VGAHRIAIRWASSEHGGATCCELWSHTRHAHWRAGVVSVAAGAVVSVRFAAGTQIAHVGALALSRSQKHQLGKRMCCGTFLLRMRALAEFLHFAWVIVYIGPRLAPALFAVCGVLFVKTQMTDRNFQYT
jgi:hypothetical protein